MSRIDELSADLKELGDKNVDRNIGELRALGYSDPQIILEMEEVKSRLILKQY